MSYTDSETSMAATMANPATSSTSIRKAALLSVDSKNGLTHPVQHRASNRAIDETAFLDNCQRLRSSIASRIRMVLAERGWSQAKLAEKSGLIPAHVSRIVNANQNLTLETVALLESVLGARILEVPAIQAPAAPAASVSSESSSF